MKRFEFVEHTADIAVKVYGGSLKELFTSAALAMFHALAVKRGNYPKSELKDIVLSKSEEELEDLLKSWLDELLLCYSTQHLVLHRIKSLECTEEALEAKVLMDTLDDVRYEVKDKIKAVSRRGLKVEKTRNGWKAFIVFDA
jgi:SHS2 domain-containing protein